MNLRYCLTIFSICCSVLSFAQPFQPDEVGYVKDPAFHQLLRERKYEIVTTFDSVKGYPGIYAFALRAKSTYMIDVNGKETLFTEEETERRRDWDEPDKPKKPLIETRLQIVEKDNGSRYIKHQDGTEYELPKCDKIVPLKYAERFPMTAFSYKIGEKWGLLSDKGTVTLAPTYLAIREQDSVPERFVVLSESKLLGIIDRDARIVLEPCLKGIHSNVVGNYGFMNTTSHGLVDLMTGQSVYPYAISDRRFKGTIYYVTSGQQSGLFDLARLKEILPPVFEYFYEESGGVFVVKKQLDGVSKHGLCDTTGKIIIPTIYDQLMPCPNTELLLLKSGELYGMITTQNKMVIPAEYQTLVPIYAPHFKNTGYLVFTKRNLTGVMNMNQEIIIKADRCNIKATETGLCVRKAEGSGVYSFTGEERIKPVYFKINDSAKPGIFTAHKYNDPAIYKVDFYGNEIKVDLPSTNSFLRQ